MYDSYYDPSYYSAYSSAYSSAADTDAVRKAVSFLLGLGILFWIVVIGLAVLILIARWKLFKKANVAGWESLIPIHSDIVELQLGGVSSAVWFLNLIAICGIGPIIVSFWKSIALAKAFGKGTGFGVLLVFFPYVCYPVLAFGSAQYVGAGVQTPGVANANVSANTNTTEQTEQNDQSE